MTDNDTAHIYRPRVDPELVGDYAKDAVTETFLERFNAQLAPHAESEYLDLDETVPTLHVIGAPRSGTTLLHQAIVSRLELGYVDNLVAAFWRAPTYGLRLSHKLGLAEQGSSFESSFGRTGAAGEPHEFGYFWNDQLGYPDLVERGPEHDAAIDWPRLRRVLINMAHVAGKPMVFKPMLLLWHLETMLEQMPLTAYVWIRRDARQVALSLLKMRESMFGTPERWASLCPRDAAAIGGDDPVDQVVAQVLLLERTIAWAVERMGAEHVLQVDHAELCGDPEAVVARVRQLLERKGVAVATRGAALAPFAVRENDQLEQIYGQRMDAAFERIAGRLETAAGGSRIEKGAA